MASSDPFDPDLHDTVKAPVPSDPWIGKSLKKYAIVARLGRGGMGVVYLAEDKVLKRAVAIKMVASSLTEDTSGAQRFLREAQSAARLQHANVVAIYDIDQDAGTHYLVMEFVPGPSAQQIIDREGALPWRAAVQIVAGACRGLVAAHASELIHRDIKPANLLVSRTGEVKLSDFGLAKLVTAEQTSITQGKYLIGTPQFMSPEQAKNEDLDERSDLYSLGATLYALLTGDPPFAGRDLYSTMYAHATLPVPDPRAKRADIPEPCVKIVQRAMAKRRSERYADAAEMLADLDTLLGPKRESLASFAEKFDVPHPTDSRSGTTPDVRRPHASKRGKWAAMAAGFLGIAIAGPALLICGGVSIYYVINRDAQPPMPKEDSPEQLVRELKARNPKFNGALRDLVQRDGRILKLGLDVKDVTDITPLGELTALEELTLEGKDENTPFADIRPLTKLTKITSLRIRFCKVKNIDALQNMKSLTDLHLGALNVNDLSALKGLPIKRLRLGASHVANLKGTEDLPLELLDLGSCYSIKSLEGLPTKNLQWLSIAYTLVPSLVDLKRADKLAYLDYHWATLTTKQEKLKLGRSLDPDDLEILRELKGLKEVVGNDFTPAEKKALQEGRPSLIVRDIPHLKK